MDYKEEFKKSLALLKAKIYDFKSGKKVADTGHKGEIQAPNTNMPESFDMPDKASAQDSIEPKAVSHQDPVTLQATNDKPHKGGLYAFEMTHGSLVGKAPAAGKHAPCPGCVSRWLTQRGVKHKQVNPSSVSIPSHVKHALSSKEHDPHTVHEISPSGETIEMNAEMHQHPSCPHCKNAPVHGPQKEHAKLNYAFSPWSKIQTARYSTPSDNLWVTSAKHSGTGETTWSAGSDRETSRRNAVIGKEPGQTGEADFMPTAGKLHKAEPKGHLVVGSNSYMRSHLPFHILQQHDLHLFHHKEGDTHRAGIIGLSRTNVEAEPIYVHAKGLTGHEAIHNAIHHFVMESHRKDAAPGRPIGPAQAKKNTWLVHAIDRHPRKDLRDVLTEVPEQKITKSLPIDWEDLNKAKIYDFGSKKMVADLPTDRPSESKGFAEKPVMQPDPDKEKAPEHMSGSELSAHHLKMLDARFGSDSTAQETHNWISNIHKKGHDEPYVGGDTVNAAWRTKEKDSGKWNNPIPFPARVKDLKGTLGKRVAQGGNDPFAWMDSKWGATKHILAQHKDKPLNIHTRSDLIARTDYMEHLTPGKHKIHMHMPAAHEKAGDFSRQIEPGAASPQRRLEAVKHLKAAGHDVTVVHDKFEHPDLHGDITKQNKISPKHLNEAGLSGVPVQTNTVKLSDKGLKRMHRAMGITEHTPKSTNLKVVKSMQPGMTINDLSKAKIIEFGSGKVLANLPNKATPQTAQVKTNKKGETKIKPVKAKKQSEVLTPLSDTFLNSKEPITVGQLQETERHIDWSKKMIDQAHPDRDADVLDWHNNYLDRISNRLSHSIENTKKRMDRGALRSIPKSDWQTVQHANNPLKPVKKTLDKAKIYDMSGKKLANLPTNTTPKEAQPIVRGNEKGITNRQHLKEQFNPNIMPDEQKKK